MTPGSLGMITLIAMVTAIVPIRSYAELSPWVGGAVFIIVFVFCHGTMTASQYPPIPQLALIFAGVQMVLVSWSSYYHPPSVLQYWLGDATPEYLAYGAPSFVAFALGWFLPLIWLPSPTRPAPLTPGTRMALRRELDILFYTGLLATVASGFISIPVIGFLVLLTVYLKYVAVFLFVIAGLQGWAWRLGLVFAFEALISTAHGMFGEMAFWAVGAIGILLFHLKRPPWQVLLFLLFAVTSLPAVERAKIRVREVTWGGQETFRDEFVVFGKRFDPEGVELPFAWALIVLEEYLNILTFNMSEEQMDQLSIRHNHGWIVHKVMTWVPDYEPYADGETVAVAFGSALVPRILMPDKYRAGGELFERFTGHTLVGNTSMNLGFSGEFYANFGHSGGITASGLLGLLCGWGYLLTAQQARRSPLWWAFWPFVFFYAMKAETGLGELTNWVVKSTVVAGGAIVLMPTVRELLFAPAPGRDRHAPLAAPRPRHPKATPRQ